MENTNERLLEPLGLPQEGTVVVDHLNVILRCDKCGTTWAFSRELEDLDRLLNIPKRLLNCRQCGGAP